MTSLLLLSLAIAEQSEQPRTSAGPFSQSHHDAIGTDGMFTSFRVYFKVG